MLFINKLFNSIACLLSFTNLQLVIPGRTWILLYLGRTVYKRLWAYLALYWGWCWSRYGILNWILWFDPENTISEIFREVYSYSVLTSMIYFFFRNQLDWLDQLDEFDELDLVMHE